MKIKTMKEHINYVCGCISIRRKDGFWWNSPCSSPNCEMKKYKKGYEFPYQTLGRLAKESDEKMENNDV